MTSTRLRFSSRVALHPRHRWAQSCFVRPSPSPPTYTSLTDGAETNDGREITSFDWLVQVYDFDLERSNNFFLWMFEGGPSMQGNQSIDSLSSSFFNITNEPLSTTTSTLPTTTTTLSSTSLSTSSVDSTSSIASTSSISSTSSSPPEPTEGASDRVEDSGGASGLPTGAIAGIAVGAGLVGIAIVAFFIMWYLRLKKKEKELAMLREQTTQAWNEFQNQKPSPPVYYQPPSELMHHSRVPELQ
ncbi:hypothetical protein B0I35DRAFT_77077 [Stachybotrys elegans]|uniref:Mid2 domain-containing protein n=1 Tax=Stachybotrys elegans TaxID=80388 RepID=A0A8K0SIP0_9HYPO|nr:hypothetical protein B0I35DRAFT_77077 [Stachybotrys elegans]